MENITAVSYTHLDVYKRQILLLAVIAGIILTVIGIRLLLIELSKSKKEDFKGNNIEKK